MIALGTAQFGTNYGINNNVGSLSTKQCFDLLNTATAHGINCFDTAPDYGQSETVISEWLQNYNNKETSHIEVVSKIPKLKSDQPAKEAVERLLQTKNNITSSSLKYILLHDELDILKAGVFDAIMKVKGDGFIDKIGVSVYTPEVADVVIGNFDIDAIQIPINIFDNRMIISSIIEKCERKKIRIFARSIFLQGLALIETSKIPQKFEQIRKSKLKIEKICRDTNWKIKDLCFSYVRSQIESPTIVIGAETKRQIIENSRLKTNQPLEKEIIDEILKISTSISSRVSDPRQWERL
ncbi:aldo/keto reductase [Paracoccaceae bacterium]|nr:aldo/keto reductase [Paracoccaceae bacterium]